MSDIQPDLNVLASKAGEAIIVSYETIEHFNIKMYIYQKYILDINKMMMIFSQLIQKR